jgi:hypothetical protein
VLNKLPVGVSLSVSIPLIAFALNMDAFANMWNELKYDYLMRLGIRILALWPRPSPSSRPERWTMRLEECRAKYTAVEPEDKVQDDFEFRAKRLAKAMRASSMPKKTVSWGLARPKQSRALPPIRSRFRKVRGEEEGGMRRADNIV